MPVTNSATRRLFLPLGLFIIIAIVFIASFRSRGEHDPPIIDRTPFDLQPSIPALHDTIVSPNTLHGPVIAPRLGNETIKAELGRAAWKLLHTTMARFPDRPTADESEALRSYIHLFQRLYPCGECAQHFGQILRKYPPQVSSRSAAAVWGCHVHNEVNKSLEKDIFDCSKIGDFYDCGCADDEKEEMNRVGEGKKPLDKRESRERFVGADGRSFDSANRMPRERRVHVDFHKRSTEI